MEMNFEHEERLRLKLFPATQGAKVTAIATLSAKVVDAKAEIIFLLYSARDLGMYLETRTVAIGVPTNVVGEVFYVEEQPKVQIMDDCAEVFVNVKMRTAEPLSDF